LETIFDLAEADKAGYGGLKKFYLEHMPKNRPQNYISWKNKSIEIFWE